MKQLRVGIVGTGMAFERLHLPAYQRLTGQYRIVALCDRNIAKARAWAQKLGISQQDVTGDPRSLALCDDVDVIDIMVPIEANFAVTEEVAKAVARSGKGIICEKPLAATEPEAAEARELPRKYQIPIMIAENYRYNDEIRLIAHLIQEKRVGEPIYFMQNRVLDTPTEMWQDKFTAKEWRQHPRFPGGVILDTGVHDVAALHCIFGPVAGVHAYGVPHDADYAPFAVVQANLRFVGGVTGQFAFFCAGKEMQRPLIGLRVFCTAGMIYLEERDAGTVCITHNDGRAEQIPYQPQQGFYHELLNFYHHITKGEPLASPPETEYGDLMVMLAILRSAEEGGRVVSVNLDEPAYV